ncbi:uncharacterized protein LOC117650682 [Thrips palmi]|uniref:Uncharacterized protein LOC117650682 n=1 Tax=Thrips palmi TaxID=161013 RepID=A0A6P8ZXL1_THRPL|nr:uncharacterized protein LOC117650682 [Thrips palmi]
MKRTRLSKASSNDTTSPREPTNEHTPSLPDTILATPVTGAAQTPAVTPELSHASSSQRKRTRVSGASSESPKRKRSRNSFRWKATVRKQLKNLGQPYTSAKGKAMEGALMRNPCSCKSNCRHKLTEDQRKAIFTQFWGIGNHERQWEYIRQNSNSKCTDSKRRNFTGKKKTNRTFFFLVDVLKEVEKDVEIGDDIVTETIQEIVTEKIIICKKMFMATLGIWDSWIDSAYKHLNAKKGNITTPDKRGRHPNHPKAVTPEKIETVKEHCNLFPRVPSHYCREKSKREYLEHGLSLSKMAKLYTKWAEEKGLPKNKVATARQYKDVVNTSFNIGFFKPKKDQCALCALIRSKHNPRHIKDKYKDLYAAHIKRKQLVKKIKLRDRAAAEKDKEIAVISFDLQKQLPCPRSEEVERNGHCYVWHEGLAKKGSKPGHTHMDADTIHARIENSTNLKEIMDFEDWIVAISEAKETLPPYNVIKLKQSMIFDYKHLVSLQNWKKDMKGKEIKWSKAREVSIDGREGNLVRLRYDLDGEIFTLSPNQVGRPVNLKTFKPPKQYNGPVPLTASKRADIEALCKELAIPLDKQQFFRDCGDDLDEVEYETDEEIIASIQPNYNQDENRDDDDDDGDKAEEEDDPEDEDGNEDEDDNEDDNEDDEDEEQ